jgi:hypothetical protein
LALISAPSKLGFWKDKPLITRPSSALNCKWLGHKVGDNHKGGKNLRQMTDKRWTSRWAWWREIWPLVVAQPVPPWWVRRTAKDHRVPHYSRDNMVWVRSLSHHGLDIPDTGEVNGLEIDIGKIYAVRAGLAKHVVYLTDDPSDRYGCYNVRYLSVCELVRPHLVGR